MKNTCYVTGKPAFDVYYFGSPIHVVLSLTQEVFAHFIIRAGKDNMHQQIMKDIKTADDNSLLKAENVKNASPNTDDYIDSMIELSIAVDKTAELLTQKSESGVRILRQMKKEYEQTGKLTS